VTYEVTAQNAGVLDSFNIPVSVSYTSVGTTSPALGTIMVSGTYAPTALEVTALNPTFGIPRFADTSTAMPFVTIGVCPMGNIPHVPIK